MFCVRHLYTNYREQFNGKALKDALWAVAKTTIIPHFRRAMEELRLLSEDAYDWLMKRPGIHWSRSHFQTHTKCEMLLNNLCESFNAVIVKARSKPIVTMFQIIHTMLMRKIQMRRDIMMRQPGDLCPKLQKKLEVAKIESGRCIAQWSSGTKFQMDARGGDQFVVDLTERTCSCREFDLTGLPCSHAIVAINYKRDKPEDYVDVCYSKVMYLEIYGHLIQPMNVMSMWEVTENPPIQPPLYTRQPGRPKNKRNKEAVEKEKEDNPTQNEATNISGDIPQPQQLSRKGQRTVKCGICKKEGHNTRTHHRHLPTRQEASSSSHGASSNLGGVPRKRGRKPKASSTAGGGNSEVQTDGRVKKRKTRQPRK
ncbi:uncharacterized protein [Malus domestica]|uniref:uncharacterized protein n=1 Tax=Malus domestica TaxID=3750 RepID=UPI0007ECC0EC